MNEVTGKFTFDTDSKRYYTFQIETEHGIVGTVYVPKNMEPLPDRIVLDRADKKEVV